MSAENVEKIIGKAVVDGEYRRLLFSEPDKALEGYELTEEEKSALIGLEREKFDAVAGELEDRISRAGMTSIGSKEIKTSLNQLFGGEQFNQTELVASFGTKN